MLLEKYVQIEQICSLEHILLIPRSKDQGPLCQLSLGFVRLLQRFENPIFLF